MQSFRGSMSKFMSDNVYFILEKHLTDKQVFMNRCVHNLHLGLLWIHKHVVLFCFPIIIN